ncbi:MAG: 1-acyl-sn-glycerol-3-phosphate acyltransferase [Clostridia bacterium]|nr:1-acyl-sn-glycerol-3-phosphate acyltransferase [Clostridia bacterium]
MKKDKKVNKAGLFSIKNFVLDFVRITAAPGMLWFRPKHIYENEAAKKRIKGAAIVIMNHVGMIDPMYLMLAIWYRRHRFVCKSDLMQSKLGGFWLRLFRCIPIDRENASFATMRQITDVLKEGNLVSMFPEGQVNTGSEMPAAFKSGMILMSVQSGAPIIPVYIKPRKHAYERIIAVIGEPFSVTEKYGPHPKFSQIDEAARYLHEKELKLMELINKPAERNEKNG